MSNIIKISTTEIGARTVPTTSARDLHAFLEVGRDFSNWIRDRIEQYEFEEGQDYLITEIGEQLPSGTKYRKEYNITLDMAKELAMVERNAKGKQARQYFIECERQAKTIAYTAPKAPRPLSRNQVAASILLLRSAAEDLKLAPSAVLGGYQRLELQLGVTGLLPSYSVDAPSTTGVGSSEETKSAAELLEIHGVGLSSIAFNRLLVEHGFLEERERPSSKGGVKKFKVCTDMEYGKNLTSPNNPRETQPHWYVRKFSELLDLVLPAKPRAVGA